MEMSNDHSQLYKIRHSLAHVLAQAVQLEYPEVKLGFGPPIDNGFYYDFDFGTEHVTDADLKKIEKRMKKIISQNQAFERVDTDFEGALKICEEIAEPYKKENVENLKDRGTTDFSFYKNGPFTDICEGPHVDSTKELPTGAFKLDRVAGAYWLGDEKNKMLTRIYALAFENREQLDDYLKRRKLALENDHKKLGKDLELFHFDDKIGKGLPLWLPNGTVIRKEVERYAEEMEFRFGYKRVHTPCISKQDLYLTSQHLPAYEESMFPPMVYKNEETGHEEKYYLRPMNCPHHHMIYGSRKRSYRELPLRLAEYGETFRFEQSGELSGLIRVRSMAINDGHIYCRENQVKDEIRAILKMYQEFYATFMLKDYKYRLSVRGVGDTSKFKGDEKMWENAEKILKEMLEEAGLDYYVGEGEAAFYGPKIDIQFRNTLGREETVSTIQIDFLAAQNFEMKYVNEHGEDEYPVVLHRAPLSTHERFISYLIEYYGGAFPVWCAPVQVRFIPVNEKCVDYCHEYAAYLTSKGMRVEVDASSESFSKKVRNGAMKKIPLLAIVGHDELESESVSMRRFGSRDQTVMKKADFTELLEKEITERSNYREPVGAIL